MKTITPNVAKTLTCLSLIDLAKTDDVARHEIESRAGDWELCAVGDAARKLGCNPYTLINIDCKIHDWGLEFCEEIYSGRFWKARRLYGQIERRVKNLFGTKAKREKYGPNFDK